jgi:hypothetical protein
VSATEILAQLPKLSADDLQAVWLEAAQLLEGRTITASRELLAAVDAGDASFDREETIAISDARREVRSWKQP